MLRTILCMKEDIRGMYPRLTDEERIIAAENLDRYLEFAWEIWEENQLARRMSFDGNDRELYDQGKVDSPIN